MPDPWRKKKKNGRWGDPEYRRKKQRLAMRRWRQNIKKNHPEKYEKLRERDRMKTPDGWRKIGMTKEKFSAMLAAQDGLCAVCGANGSGKRGKLFVDHDHVTLKIRGLLCSMCNSALGFLKDSVPLMVKAAYYLQKNAAVPR